VSSPTRHWRSYGNDPLPTPAEALNEPFAASFRICAERLPTQHHDRQGRLRAAKATDIQAVTFPPGPTTNARTKKVDATLIDGTLQSEVA
jgi:hypothetical protein